MDIHAERLNFPDAASMLLTGQTLFEEPQVKLCIQDGQSDGSGTFTSVVVDLVPYVKATTMAAGHPEDVADATAKQRYMEALVAHDVDGFEAEMFWDTYVDTEWTKANPYAVEQNPYIDPDVAALQQQQANPDVGWGPQNNVRTPGAPTVDV